MKVFFLFAVATLAITTPVYSQSVLWTESFESEGANYYSSSTFYDGANDMFSRTDGTDISIVGGSYSNFEGSYFWSAEDLDDAGDTNNDGLPVKEIIFQPVTTTGYTDITLSGLFGAGNNSPPGANAYDDEDSLSVQYSLDGGNNFITAMKFASMGDQSNEPLALDSDLDGVGDSTLLSPVLQEFSFSLPDSDSIIIKVIVSLNAGNEEIAFDYFKITATPDGTVELPTKASFISIRDTLSEGESYDLGILIENPKDSVFVEFEIAENGESGLSFYDKIAIKALNDTVVFTSILFSDDHLLNGTRQVEISIKSIEGGYDPQIKEPDKFTFIITDNDAPIGGEVVISEIMYDSYSSTDQEWLELRNTTGFTINLSGWYITDDDSYPADSEGDFFIPDSTFILPNGYVVLSWDSLPDFEGEVVVDKSTGYRSYSPGLINSGDNIALYFDGILVDGSDSINYDDSSPVNSGYSIERHPIDGYSGHWAASVNNYGGSEIIRGTPGEVNSTHYTSVSFIDSEKSVSEDSGSIKLQVQIKNPSDTASTHLYLAVNGDTLGIQNRRFDPIIFPAGSVEVAELEISIVDDNDIAKFDTLIFSLYGITGGNKSYLKDSIFQLIITDNDFTEVSFSLDSISVSEGDSVEVKLIINNPYNETEVKISNTTADEFTLVPSTISFSQEDTVQSFYIKGIYDRLDEDELEFFKISISEITGGNFASVGADSSLVITLHDQKTKRFYIINSTDSIGEEELTYKLKILRENNDGKADSPSLSFLNGDPSAVSFNSEIVILNNDSDTLEIQLSIFNDNVIEIDQKLKFQLNLFSTNPYAEIVSPSNFELFIINDDSVSGGEVIISEIMYDSYSSTDQEWIELYNTTENIIDLSGWYITDDDSYPADSEGDFFIPESTFIFPNGYLVVSWDSLPDFEGEIVVDKNTGYRNYSPGLINSGDNISLYFNGVLVDGSDSINYDDASPANTGYSIERHPVDGYSGLWAASVNNYEGSEIIRGTPGEVNSTHYTSVSFVESGRIVSEDSVSIKLQVQIENPSDTASTQLYLALKGDTLEIQNRIFDPIIFSSGSKETAEVDIFIVDDNQIAKNDTLVFSLYGITGGNKSYLRDSVFQLIITDNDFTEVSFILDSVMVKEGDSVEVQLRIKNPYEETEINISSTGEEEFIIHPSNITFSPKDTIQSFYIKGIYDRQDEAELEYFNLSISEVIGGNLASKGADSSIVVNLLDQKAERFYFTDSMGTVVESDTFLLKIVREFSDTKSDSVIVNLIAGDSSFTNQYKIIHAFPVYTDTLQIAIPVSDNIIAQLPHKLLFKLELLNPGEYSAPGGQTEFELTIIDDEISNYPLVINEILFDPHADSVLGDINGDGYFHNNEDEFIEIVNMDTLSIDLGSMTINDAAQIRHTFPGKTILKPKQAIVIFGGGTPSLAFSNDEAIIQTASTGSLSLNNTGDSIFLIKEKDTVTRAEYTGSIGNDQSITRAPEIYGEFLDHSSITGALYSPGLMADGKPFYEFALQAELVIDTSKLSLDFGTVTFPDTSVIQSFILQGKNINEPILLDNSGPFEVSKDQLLWSNSLEFLPSADSLNSEVFLRLIPANNDSLYHSVLKCWSGNSDTLLINLTGIGEKLVIPEMEISHSFIELGSHLISQTSVSSYYVLTISVDSLLIETQGNFTISADSIQFSQSLKLYPESEADSTKIFVKFEASTTGAHADSITHLAVGVDPQILSVEAEVLEPIISTSSVSLEFGVFLNDTTTMLYYDLSAEALIEDLEVITSGDFSVSLTQDLTDAEPTIAIAPDELGSIESRIYVFYKTTSEGNVESIINHSTSFARQLNLNVSAAHWLPELSSTKEEVSFGVWTIDDISTANYYILTGKSIIEDVIIVAPQGYKLNSSTTYPLKGDSLELTPSEGVINDTVYVFFAPENIGMYNDSIRHYTLGQDFFIKVNGESAPITSIAQMENHFKIYPNPVDEELIIHSEPNVISRIELIDQVGKCIYKNSFLRTHSINTSTIKNGLYLVRIYSYNQVLTRKVIVKH